MLLWLGTETETNFVPFVGTGYSDYCFVIFVILLSSLFAGIFPKRHMHIHRFDLDTPPPKTIVNELNAIVTGWFIDRFCKSGHTFIESTSRRWVSENPTRNAKWKGLITVEKTRCARAIEKKQSKHKKLPSNTLGRHRRFRLPRSPTPTQLRDLKVLHQSLTGLNDKCTGNLVEKHHKVYRGN